MSVITLEGIVEEGQIRLSSDLSLPDNTKVYVVIPNMRVENVAHVISPRLADLSQSIDFKMEISEESLNDPL